jgi:hypothetical protein
VAVFVTDVTAKCAPTIWPLSKLGRSPICRFFHADCHSTQSLMHWQEHYRAHEREEEHSVHSQYYISHNTTIFWDLHFCDTNITIWNCY